MDVSNPTLHVHSGLLGYIIIENLLLIHGQKLLRDRHTIGEVVGTVILPQTIHHPGIQYLGRDEELLAQFLLPLLAKHGRHNDKDTPPAFRPFLGEDDTRFNRLATANLIGQNCPVREGRAQNKERRVDLMGIEVNPSVGNGPRQRGNITPGPSKGQGMGPVLAMVSRSCGMACDAVRCRFHCRNTSSPIVG